MTMKLPQILPPPEPPPPPKSAGAWKDVEALAIFLCTSTKINPMPTTRLELLEIWEARDPEVRVAYLLRARRLLKAWSS
jgi:hypothetical protein